MPIAFASGAQPDQGKLGKSLASKAGSPQPWLGWLRDKISRETRVSSQQPVLARRGPMPGLKVRVILAVPRLRLR